MIWLLHHGMVSAHTPEAFAKLPALLRSGQRFGSLADVQQYMRQVAGVR